MDGSQEHKSPAGKRVLSIQSWVVHGYVGNKVATFVLQLHGLDVDPVNSVQFSNHTGYRSWKGQRLEGQQLLDLIAGLEDNALLGLHTHLLTGYVGSISFMQAILQVIDKLKRANPELIYVCDPVMGDDGRMYVPKEFVEIYRTQVLPHATVVTPNQTELELLSGRTVRSEVDVLAAIDLVHAMGPSIVVVTSSSVGDNQDIITLYASSQRNHEVTRYRMRIPRVEGYYSGTGDATTALLLSWLEREAFDIRHAIEKTVATLQAVIKRTHAAGSRELLVVQSKGDIENPSIVIHAEPL